MKWEQGVAEELVARVEEKELWSFMAKKVEMGQGSSDLFSVDA